MSDRKIERNRYVRRSQFFLDCDDGGYTNVYKILDGEKDTGIRVAHTRKSRKGNNEQIVTFRGTEYPSIRNAIFAYEDANIPHGENI